MIVPFDDPVVKVGVVGGVVLQGLGSARPSTDERYLAGACTTFRGRAQAVVRRVDREAGELEVESEGLTAVRLVV